MNNEVNVPKENPSNNKTQADRLFDFAKERLQFFKTKDEWIYYKPIGSRDSTVAKFKSPGLRRWLIGEYRRRTGKCPTAAMIESAILALESEAHESGITTEVFRRYGHHDDSIYVDLGSGSYVKITSDSFEVVDSSPIYFVRPKGMLPLPMPHQDGVTSNIWQILKIEDRRIHSLIEGAIVGFMNPRINSAGLVIEGPQGSGKSTLAEVVKLIVDPEIGSRKAFPKNEKDLGILCMERWLLSLDNLSGLQTWAQDALCRIITGGTISYRELYTNYGEVNLSLRNPILLNGIDDIATRPDLAERSIVVSLPKIDPKRRSNDAQVFGLLNRKLPDILGGFYKAISYGLKNQHSTHVENPPRMADFVHFVTAAEGGLCFEPGEFLKNYREAQKEVESANIEGFPAIMMLADFLKNHYWPKQIEMSSSEILALLDSKAKERGVLSVQRYDSWPKSAQQLSNQIRRSLPLLSSLGIEATADRTSVGRKWKIWVREPLPEKE